MVYKVDGNPQLDTCDWSMYSNILRYKTEFFSFRSFDLNSSVCFVNMRGKATKSGEQVVIFNVYKFYKFYG